MGVVTNLNGTAVKHLDVGAGAKRIEGYTTMDISPEFEPDVLHDLLDVPWPFEDDSWDELRCHHVMEHIPAGNPRIAVMNEMWRILKPGCEVEIEVPVFPYWTAIADPTHVSFFVRQSFWYFCIETFRGAPDWAEQRRLYGVKPWSMKSEARDEQGGVLRVSLAKVVAES